MVNNSVPGATVSPARTPRWLIKPANFLKVLEGTYDNSKKARGFNNATERSYDFDDLELKLIATN